MIETIFIAVSVLFVAWPLSECVSAWVTKRSYFLRHMGRHVRTQIASRRIWLPLLATVAICFLPFSLGAKKPAFIVAVSCIWVGTSLQWITPPSILLLGVSGSKCNELLPSLVPKVFPAKVIHLLSDNYLDQERSFNLKLHTLFTTSRTSGSVGWEAVVSTYLHVCERILVDLRDYSGNLQLELTMIGASAAWDKVLYLVADVKAAAPLSIDPGSKNRTCKTVSHAIWRLRMGY